MRMPSYFIGTWQNFQDIQSGKITIDCEFHVLCVDDPPTPTSLCCIIMRDSHSAPHADWVEFPHILSPTPLVGHFNKPDANHVTTQLSKIGITLTATDTSFSLVSKLHSVMPVFKP